MKKNALVVIGIVAVLALGIIGVSAQTVALENNNGTAVSTVKSPKVPVESARKIALKKFDGKITEEFTLEEEDGTVSVYVFKIKAANKKMYEVQVDANTGDILYAEEDVA